MDDVMINMDLESKIKDALKGIDGFRTPDCLDDSTIGRFAENKLAEPQRLTAGNHLHTCIYCMKQLNDITELLHAQKHPVPLSPRLEALGKRITEQTSEHTQKKLGTSFFQRVKEMFSFTPQQWRFSAIGLATAWVVFLTTTAVMHQGNQGADKAGMPILDSSAFVKVQALSDAGTVLKEEQGVVIGSDGLIASKLSPLAGATRLQVTLKDGTTYQTDSLWKDEDKNLAVMRVGNKTLKAIPLGDISEIVGKKIYAVPDSPESSSGLQEALASDVKEFPGRKNDGGPKYIQVATQTVTSSKGAIVDEHGRFLGLLITEEKHVNLATSVEDITKLAATSQAIPLSQLKQVNFSGEAFNAYMKGILARDGQRWGEAIKFYQKAVKLNPHLEGAYVELGYAFYRVKDFDREADAYNAALNINPNNADALFNLAENLESHYKYPEAIVLYEKALAIEPEDMEVLYQAGLSYLAQGNRTKATEMYNRLKTLDRGNAEILRQLIK